MFLEDILGLSMVLFSGSMFAGMFTSRRDLQVMGALAALGCSCALVAVHADSGAIDASQAMMMGLWGLICLGVVVAPSLMPTRPLPRRDHVRAGVV